MKTSHFAIALFILSFLASCNKEEFYGTSIAVEGVDAVCSTGVDIESCEALPGCQVALEDVESVNPVFAACIANPPSEPPTTSQPPSSPPVAPPEVEPEIIVTYENKCENLDAKYLYVKTYKKDGVEKRVKKVKLCHQTSNGEHAIIVACPALKAHRKHDDYLGACKE